MTHFPTLKRLALFLIAVLTATGIFPGVTAARPVVKLGGNGFVALSTDGPSSFLLQGNGSHLGRYTCAGEVEFFPGETRGTWEGEGVVAIQSANGDLLVGVASWQLDADGNGTIAFSWRDSVQFSNGLVVNTTGRFIQSRPAGTVTRVKSISDGTSNIIAILIG